MKPVLEVKDLEISFFNGNRQTKCTDRVSFHVNPGEILCIVGESGCGKSITVLSILGLLSRQSRMTQGQILYQERDLLQMTEKELDAIRGSEISMIFQDVMYSLNTVFTIGSQLTEAIRRHLRYGRAEAQQLAVRLLDRTGIPQLDVVMRKYPHQLSGGMRQRVMIAMALSCRPKLLIADEPTTALDVTMQLQIMQLLRELRDETGMAMLLITHDIGVVAEMADRVVVMYAGQCVEKADARQLLTAPAHPYPRALLDAAPSADYAQRSRQRIVLCGEAESTQWASGCAFRSRCPYAKEACAQAGCNMQSVAPGSSHFSACVLQGKEDAGADRRICDLNRRDP